MKGLGLLGIALAFLLGNKPGSTTTLGATGPSAGPQPLGGGDPGTFVPTPSPSGPFPMADTFVMPETTPQETPEQSVFAAPAMAVSSGTGIFTTLQAPRTTSATSYTAVPDLIRSYQEKIGWTWLTPQGPVTSRPPTEEEKDIGCPEVPEIWTYPGASQQDLKYCANPQCPSNNPERLPNGEMVAPTPAVLEQQKDSQGRITYYCRVCRTIQ